MRSDTDTSGIELTHLRYFVVLAEELHFGRAAARLNLSQPPLTQQIQRLESRVGYPLLRRTSRRTELTEAGRAFRTAALGVLNEMAAALETTRRVARGESGQITLATPPSLMLKALPRILLEIRRKAPGVQVRLKEMATSRVFEALASGGADLGLARGHAVPSSVEAVVSWAEPAVAILPRRHPLATAKRFSLPALSGEPFVFFPREVGPALHDELLNCCRAAGFEPRIVQEATQWSSVLSLVAAGVGVSIGPASVENLLKGSVVVRTLPRYKTEIHLVRSPNRENPVAHHVIEAIRRSVAG
jgi:DNA-binding transcriptional LysR family regulator